MDAYRYVIPNNNPYHPFILPFHSLRSRKSETFCRATRGHHDVPAQNSSQTKQTHRFAHVELDASYNRIRNESIELCNGSWQPNDTKNESNSHATIGCGKKRSAVRPQLGPARPALSKQRVPSSCSSPSRHSQVLIAGLSSAMKGATISEHDNYCSALARTYASSHPNITRHGSPPSQEAASGQSDPRRPPGERRQPSEPLVLCKPKPSKPGNSVQIAHAEYG